MVVVKTRWSREWKITTLSMVIFLALFLGLYLPSNNNSDDNNDDKTTSSSVRTSSSSSPSTTLEVIIISPPTISPTTIPTTTTTTIIDNKIPPTHSPVVVETPSPTPIKSTTSSPTTTRPTTSPTLQPTTLEPTNSPTDYPSEVPTTPRPSPSPTITDCLETNLFLLDITFDVFASETSWNFVDLVSGEIIYESPPDKYDDGLSGTTFVGCLPDGSYIFTLHDLCGDGMMYPGYYELMLGGGSSTVILSGDDGSFEDEVSVSFDVPFDIDSPNSSPTPSPTVCPETNMFELELTFDYYSDETSWDIIEGPNGDIVYKSPDYGHHIAGSTVIETGCLLDENDYIFRLYDSFGDGLLGVDGNDSSNDNGSYKFSVGGSVVVSGGDEEFNKITVAFEVPYYDNNRDETLIID